MTLVELVAKIAKRDATRTEATLQADIRQLPLTAPLSLTAENVVAADLETQAGFRRQIDFEAGSCLIEVKRDLSAGNVLSEATEQLTGCLAARQRQTGCRYVGILTDGSDWRCLCLPGTEAGPPREVAVHKLSPSRPELEPFLVWLEVGVVKRNYATMRGTSARYRFTRPRATDRVPRHRLRRDEDLAAASRGRSGLSIAMSATKNRFLTNLFPRCLLWMHFEGILVWKSSQRFILTGPGRYRYRRSWPCCP
jgi:hypothetical protein